MPSEILSFGKDRTLLLCSLDDDLSFLARQLGLRFVAMLPAFNATDREKSFRASIILIKLGCYELCCVGPESEDLHDGLDDLIECSGFKGVITTWHEEISDACNYFIYASGGAEDRLLGVVEGHAKLVEMLRFEVEAYSSGF